MEKKEMVCICCPLGCMLSVTMEAKENISVTGNSCPRGKTYAIAEVTDPRRIVTSTVRVRGSNTLLVPVKTKTGIPKHKVMQCIEELAAIELQAPVNTGDVVKADIAGTGVEVIATKNIA
jgi:CxxC motif-containing protein